MVLFCNLVGAHERKICEDKFGGCKKSFSWLGQRVNKKIRLTRMAAMPMTPVRTCPPDDVASRQDVSTTSSILTEFEYSYWIRYSIRIRNVEDIRFDIRFE